MNIEFEVKNVIRGGGTTEQRAEKICRITTFDKEKVMKGLNIVAETPADVYWNIVLEHKK